MLVFVIRKLGWKKRGGRELMRKRHRGERTLLEKTGVEKTKWGINLLEKEPGWKRPGWKIPSGQKT